MDTLIDLDLRGFRSIREVTGNDLKLGRLNVLIGANGSGKSNFIAFFRLLSWMARGNLQHHIGIKGGASSQLHEGSARTPQIETNLAFETAAGTNEYAFRLFHAAQDALIFAEERYRFSSSTFASKGNWTDLGAGHRESRLLDPLATKTAKHMLWLLKQCVVYQFHNTSDTARIRQKWATDDNLQLKEDGANLAPYLLRLREEAPAAYGRTVETIRQIAPFFADFELQPEADSLLLRWREKGSDLVFGPHQASDGTLRAMALVTLLMQPEANLPAVVILDEPELGLHPYAIEIIAGLLRAASHHSQVILATQSMTLIDHFRAGEIIVVERPGRESKFARLDEATLADWLKEYALGELWEKNVLGGTPSS